MRLGFHVALLFALVLAPATVAGASTGATAVQSDDLDRTGTTIEIQIREDTNARFAVETRFALNNESDRRAFERLAEDFESGSDGVGYSTAVFERASAAAENATGREMRIRRGERSSRVENGTGVLRLSFTWTNFAVSEGGRIRVGDAFNTTDGTWLPALTANQTLVVRPPSGYGVHTAPAPPRNGVLRWEGPRTFEPGYLSIAYRQTSPPTGDPPTETPGGLFGDATWLAGMAVLGAGVLVVAAFALRQRDDRDLFGVASGPGGDDHRGGAVDAPDAAAAPPDEAAADEGDEGVDPELLSDEERVEHLLQRNGGRMKQANIVKETGWSNAKVSQLLSAMDDADRIDKLRIGRENLISLPDADVTDIEE